MADVAAFEAAAAGDIAISDRVVALLLAQAAQEVPTSAVRKTTLAALVAAVEERVGEQVVDAETYRSALTPLAGSGLTDALLHLRNYGLVKLTDVGFQLTGPGSSLAASAGAEPLTEFLKVLVRQKFREWQDVTATA